MPTRERFVHVQHKVEAYFQALDTDGNGQLDIDEASHNPRQCQALILAGRLVGQDIVDSVKAV